MASTKAIFPLRARSIMSLPARGQSMTRLPLTSSTPSTVTLWSVGLSSCSLKKSILVPQHPELADGTVQVHQLLLREGLAPLQDLPRPRVRGAHLRPLLIGESENVQDQKLIYLPTVEHIARAFGSYLWIVREYDRRRKQHVLGTFLPDEHGPRLFVLTLFRELPQRLGRVCHGDEFAPFYLERGVRRAEGLAKRIPPRKASASTSTSPHSARQLRTRAPSTSPVGPVISSWLLPPEISIPARSGLSSSSDSLHCPIVISRSVASSHGR